MVIVVAIEAEDYETVERALEIAGLEYFYPAEESDNDGQRVFYVESEA